MYLFALSKVIINFISFYISVYILLQLARMLILLLISLLLLHLQGCITQRCSYNVNKFEKMTCFGITSEEQIREAVNATLDHYGSIPRLIERLKLRYCNLSSFSIHSLHFLPQLKRIEIIDSFIKKLAYKEVKDAAIDSDSESTGTGDTNGK